MQKDVFATTIVLACKNKENTENIINGIEEIDDETKLTLYPNTRKNKYLEFQDIFFVLICLLFPTL